MSRNVELQLADRDQVLHVLGYWADQGCSLAQALARQHVPAAAFWARVRRGEPEVRAAFDNLKAQWAFVAMDALFARASERAAATGSAAWAALEQRQVHKMAEALAPGVWAAAGQTAAVSGPLTRQDAIERVRALLAIAQERAAALGAGDA